MKSKILYLTIVLSLLAIWFINPGSAEADDLPANKDLIKFSHSLHAEVEIECADCHSGVTESTSLSDRLLPEKPYCAECHDVDDDENCETCHYEDVYEALVQHPSALMFDHKSHVGDLEIDCENCHQGFTKVDYSNELEHPNPPMMQCYSCHNDKTVASNTCESCHISTVDLIPQDHRQVNFFKAHGRNAEHMSENCEMCHSEDFCEACHVATVALDVTNSPTDFYTPYSPYRYNDNHKKQQITRVHDLNYRFTHGMDLKGKVFDCSSCHQTETFCAECHNPVEQDDYSLQGIVPGSHNEPNFVMIGVGSGGGLHGDLARRDIERCASCHDVQGADPSCILCHTDPDGIQGTNSKTHVAGYMKNENGDWHGNFGSVCYDCHTDPFALSQTFGQGFCGYCHK